MDIEFDPNKSAKNKQERGLPFDCVQQFNWESALIHQDTRFDYPEPRYIALGYIAERLHVLVFAETETGIRVISLRKANQREINRYEQHS